MSFWVYMMSNKPYGTIYTGQTDDLWRRVSEHKSGAIAGFTKKYGLDKLVFFETHETREQAKQRELHIKAWKRDWKISLIEEINPKWNDLALHLQGGSHSAVQWTPAFAGEAV